MQTGPMGARWGAPPLMPAPPVDPGRRRDLASAWLCGVVAGVLAVGPGLGAGSWFNVDLVVTPDTPVPRGVWALGPELPRRVPYALPLAWASALVDSTWVAKAMVVLSIAAAVAGTWRLAARWFVGLPLPARAGAGLLYGLSPFLLTRLGVGHLPLIVAMGILPWAVPALLDPARDHPRTFLWCVALGLTGFLGGILAVFVVVLALPATRPARHRLVPSVLLLSLSQLTWVVPGFFVLWQGADPASASEFRTSARGAGGVVRVLAGHGFWRQGSQVGADQGWIVPVLGVVLVVLAAFGVRTLAPRLRTSVLVVGLMGLALPLASAVPGVRRLYSALVDTPISSVLREGQRILPVYLVLLAPLAAGGAARLAHRLPGWREGIALVGPAAIALVLAGPGLWGVRGALDPVEIPASWQQARAEVRAGGGTTLSLPFFQYSQLGIAGNRSSLDPMPIFLGGDVVSSSDPELLSTRSVERADPRGPSVSAVVAALRRTEPVADEVAARGIHWIVVRHDRDWTTYVALSSDPGFRHVVSGPELDLYEVRPWRDKARVVSALSPAGRAIPVSVSQRLTPLASMDDDREIEWFRPGAKGWMRGSRSATISPDGNVLLPPGGGVVWFWPAYVTLIADLAVAGGVASALGRRRRFVPAISDIS